METESKGRPIYVIENLTREVVRLQGSDIILASKEVKRVAHSRVNYKLVIQDPRVKVTKAFEIVAKPTAPVVESKKRSRRLKKSDSAQEINHG